MRQSREKVYVFKNLEVSDLTGNERAVKLNFRSLVFLIDVVSAVSTTAVDAGIAAVFVEGCEAVIVVGVVWKNLVFVIVWLEANCKMRFGVPQHSE